jgi:hypothetical protein
MTARAKLVAVNLGLLVTLLVAFYSVYAMMHGSFGARFYAKALREGTIAEQMEVASALQGLESNGAPAVPALLERLQNTEDPAAPVAARALREIDPQAAYEYATVLVLKEPLLTRTTLEVFRNLGPIAWRAIPWVCHALAAPESARMARIRAYDGK